MADKKLEKAWRDALDFLDENYAYFMTHVLGLGNPTANPDIPTACVFWNDNLKCIEFHINPELADLSTEEFAFVISHETMHAHLSHPKYLPKFIDKTKSEEDQKVMITKLQMASDIVINDYLVARGFEIPDVEVDGKQVKKYLTGEEVVGQSCFGYSVREVLALIPDDHPMVEHTRMICGICDEAKEAIEKYLAAHPEMVQAGNIPANAGRGTAEDRARQAMEGIGEMGLGIEDSNKKDSSTIATGVQQGFGNNNEIEDWSKNTGTSFEWAKLLAVINPEMFHKFGVGKPPHRDFHKPHRKLAFFPGMHLPVVAENPGKKWGNTDQIPHIVLALDTSGSIGYDTVQKFLTLAKSIPTDRIHLWACTFSDRWMALDLDNPQYVSGGTEFSAIEDFIQYKMKEENRPKYPQAIVVITDGYAAFDNAVPEEQYWDRWNWIFEGGTDITDSRAIGANNKYQLSEYVE